MTKKQSHLIKKPNRNEAKSVKRTIDQMHIELDTIKTVVYEFQQKYNMLVTNIQQGFDEMAKQLKNHDMTLAMMFQNHLLWKTMEEQITDMEQQLPDGTIKKVKQHKYVHVFPKDLQTEVDPQTRIESIPQNTLDGHPQ